MEGRGVEAGGLLGLVEDAVEVWWAEVWPLADGRGRGGVLLEVDGVVGAFSDDGDAPVGGRLVVGRAAEVRERVDDLGGVVEAADPVVRRDRDAPAQQTRLVLAAQPVEAPGAAVLVGLRRRRRERHVLRLLVLAPAPVVRPRHPLRRRNREPVLRRRQRRRRRRRHRRLLLSLLLLLVEALLLLLLLLGVLLLLRLRRRRLLGAVLFRRRGGRRGSLRRRLLLLRLLLRRRGRRGSSTLQHDRRRGRRGRLERGVAAGRGQAGGDAGEAGEGARAELVVEAVHAEGRQREQGRRRGRGRRGRRKDRRRPGVAARRRQAAHVAQLRVLPLHGDRLRRVPPRTGRRSVLPRRLLDRRHLRPERRVRPQLLLLPSSVRRVLLLDFGGFRSSCCCSDDGLDLLFRWWS
mmetsp:Transcript_16445/g.49709  ORF Transcript_16445/g.49709 Transcript_16445/m.49709 type:complete len:405 (-) Transcript_16445:1493-2707(-)